MLKRIEGVERDYVEMLQARDKSDLWSQVS